ncbi:MAG: ribonuclease E/G, partial [Alphaproteobacteria bacterium]|nr:ribonuclease E/G [Alphaproteobacteria bacterium]
MAEVFYSVSGNLHRMARLEEGRVVSLDFEFQDKPPSFLGGVYAGRVVEIQKPLQVAFVEIGLSKPGMLPLKEGDLPPLKHGDPVLVKVSRAENPLENKGVRLTRLITLSLGSLLYTPFKSGLSLSRRLENRQVFKNLLTLEPGEGVILRHNADPKENLQQNLLKLREEWKEIQRKMGRPPPTLLERAMRSLTPSDHFMRVKTFDDRCEEAWESLSSQEISLSKGGNIYVEETHGLTVIDVNSQGALHSTLSSNRMAIEEAFRQITLRELGGKIVIDLVCPPQNINSCLKGFSVPTDTEIWGMSPMGLLELTRRRKRLSLPQRLK